MNNNFNFLVTCQKCNSTNVEVTPDINWDSCGEPYASSYICCKCHDCGNFKIVDIINQPFLKKESE